jgi:hypothetical protein
MKKKIIISAGYLANLCLANQEYKNYTDKDLENATIIFTHFLLDMIWTTNKTLTQSKKEELAETTGKAIRELIKSSTGKNMQIIWKKK